MKKHTESANEAVLHNGIRPALLGLLDYAQTRGLIEACDRTYCENRLLEMLRLDEPDGEDSALEAELPVLLQVLTEDAVRRGVIEEGVVAADLFDSLLMDALTPYPHEVQRRFAEKLAESPRTATDWFYAFSCDTNYIRRDRIRRDRKWVYQGSYGDLDITINLSKPEKDPRAIAAAKLMPQTAYPKCQLCAENEGYAGRLNHPGRSNHRLIPLKIAGEDWFFQYSPYVYYNEHCIVFNSRHTPMKIDRAAFEKLFSFVEQFPHYFVGSNADLPIVGGSILSHDHFQGGHYEFAMAKAPVEEDFHFKDFPDVSAGIVR